MKYHHLNSLLFVCSSAFAQTAPYDTSILKNGNTWLYSRQESSSNVGQVESSFSGTTKFTLDSLRLAGDTIKFRVTREDSGTQYNGPQPIGTPVYTYPHTFETASYTYRNGAFAPSIPLFTKGQTFSGSEGQVVYDGDTLRVLRSSISGCVTTSSENVEKVGRSKDMYSYQCGNTSGFTNYRLQSFNGRVFNSDSLTPVSLRAATRNLQRPQTGRHNQVALRGNQVLYQSNGLSREANGRRARLKSH